MWQALMGLISHGSRSLVTAPWGLGPCPRLPRSHTLPEPDLSLPSLPPSQSHTPPDLNGRGGRQTSAVDSGMAHPTLWLPTQSPPSRKWGYCFSPRLHLGTPPLQQVCSCGQPPSSLLQPRESLLEAPGSLKALSVTQVPTHNPHQAYLSHHWAKASIFNLVIQISGHGAIYLETWKPHPEVLKVTF